MGTAMMIPSDALPIDLIASPPLATIDLHTLTWLPWLAAGLLAALIVTRVRARRPSARPIKLRAHPGKVSTAA